MTEITGVDLVAFAIEAAILLVCAVALVGSMVRYRRHVLYRSGVGWLAASLVLVTVGALAELWGFIAPSDLFAVLAMALYAGASAAILAAMWTFARGFIRFDEPDRDGLGEDDSLTVVAPGGKGGFEDAGE